MSTTLQERLESPGPKRILTLDGGGMRGMISLCFLRRVESLLAERHGGKDFRLSDYFDLITGTSTGAIIAALLSRGYSVAEISETYFRLGRIIFGRKRAQFWKSFFSEEPLDDILEEYLGDLTLGAPDFKTGLCIVTKRADTNSTWPLINHPGGKFFEYNKDIPLKSAVRASAAAPLYFTPIKMEVCPGEEATFVDGGVSMANNPSLQALLVATLDGFPFRWKTGPDDLLMLSVGTGFHHLKVNPMKMAQQKIWDWLRHVPVMLIQDAMRQNELLMQLFSKTETAWMIDAEIGNATAQSTYAGSELLTYNRYNVLLEEDYLEEIGLPELIPELKHMRVLSSAGQVKNLKQLGDTGAEQQVKESHFPAVFDLPST